MQTRIAELCGRPGEIPEGGYHGEYIKDVAKAYVSAHSQDREGNDLETIRRVAVAELRQEQDRDLQAFGVKFDVYFLESSLYTSGAVERTVQQLQAAGHTFEKDGALWLRTTDFGDDKDRVLIKADGETTYFAADAAYYLSKKDRGFDEKVYFGLYDAYSGLKDQERYITRDTIRRRR